jgi:hypothetical protein
LGFAGLEHHVVAEQVGMDGAEGMRQQLGVGR